MFEFWCNSCDKMFTTPLPKAPFSIQHEPNPLCPHCGSHNIAYITPLANLGCIIVDMQQEFNKALAMKK